MLKNLISAIVFLVEFFNTACSIERLLLAGVERMGGRRYLHSYHGISFAVFPNDGLAGSHGRTGEEFEIAGRVCENNFVVCRMDICFHGLFNFGAQR